MAKPARAQSSYSDFSGLRAGDVLPAGWENGRKQLRKIDRLQDMPTDLLWHGLIPYPDGSRKVAVNTCDAFVSTPMLSGPPIRVKIPRRCGDPSAMTKEDDLVFLEGSAGVLSKVLGVCLTALPTSFTISPIQRYMVGEVEVAPPRVSDIRPDRVYSAPLFDFPYEAKKWAENGSVRTPVLAMPLRQLVPQLLAVQAAYPDKEALSGVLLFDSPTSWRFFLFALVGGRLVLRLSRSIQLVPTS